MPNQYLSPRFLTRALAVAMVSGFLLYCIHRFTHTEWRQAQDLSELEKQDAAGLTKKLLSPGSADEQMLKLKWLGRKVFVEHVSEANFYFLYAEVARRNDRLDPARLTSPQLILTTMADYLLISEIAKETCSKEKQQAFFEPVIKHSYPYMVVFSTWQEAALIDGARFAAEQENKITYPVPYRPVCRPEGVSAAEFQKARQRVRAKWMSDLVRSVTVGPT